MAALLLASFYARPLPHTKDDPSPSLSTGWRGPPPEHCDLEGPCTIPRVSVAEWNHRRRQKMLEPVVIEGLPSNALFQRLTQRDSLLERYGQTDIVLSSANTYSYAKKTVPLPHYLQHMMQPRTLDDIGSE